MQLASAASARAELAAVLRDTKHHFRSIFTAFSAPVIPGARGYHVGGPGNPSAGDNLLFADGPFLYLVGQGWAYGIKNPPSRSGLIAAATSLYKRVHGHPPA
jgi:hypothetical protein